MAETRPQLEFQNNTSIVTNNVGLITATVLNALVENMIESTTIPLSDYGAGVQTALTFAPDTTGGFVSVANIGLAITAYFQSLPTTLPLTSGVVWNNGGVISIS